MKIIRLASVAFPVAACIGLAAQPAMAAELPGPGIGPGIGVAPAFGHAGFDKHEANAERHRRYRHRGYRGYRNYRNRGIDAGDVLAGVLILGGIAAVIDAATDDDRDDRYRDRRYRDPRYRNDTRNDRQTTNGLERAAEICRSAIERDRRVSDVDSVRRTGAGWSVSGTLYDGQGFQCYLDNRGDVTRITYGDGFAALEDRQWDDARYRAARLQVEQGGAYGGSLTGAADDNDDDALPDYPGGPVNGEIVYADDDFGG